MHTTLLVYGVVLGLLGLFVATSPVMKTVGQRILGWANLPDGDAVAPWRVRLVILVLLYPAIATIVTMIYLDIDALGLNPNGASTDLERGVLICLETAGASLQTSAWLGLMAYGVLRRTSPGKRRLIGWVIGYWTLAYVVLNGMLAIRFPEMFTNLLNFSVVYFALFAVVLLLIAVWFWIAAKSTRGMLIAEEEENDSTGLSIKTILWSITGLGLVMLGFRLLSVFSASPQFYFDLNPTTILLGPLFSCFLVTWLMATVFLTRNRFQLLIGLATLMLLDTLHWIARDMLERANANADIRDALLRDSLLSDLLLNLVAAAAQFGALLCLKWLWHKIGLTISFGVQPTTSTTRTWDDADEGSHRTENCSLNRTPES